MSVYGNLNPDALRSLSDLMARPSQDEHLQQMKGDQDIINNNARIQAEHNERRFRASQANAARSERASVRQSQRAYADKIMEREHEMSMELQMMDDAFKTQRAGASKRQAGSTLQPGSGYTAFNQPGVEPAPTQGSGVITGPAGMYEATSQGPRQVSDIDEQIALGTQGGGSVRYDVDATGAIGQPDLRRGGGPSVTRGSGPAQPGNPFLTILAQSGLDERNMRELASFIPSIMRKNGITVAKFHDMIESRRPEKPTADDYRYKRDQAKRQAEQLRLQGGDASGLDESADYYNTKMYERQATRTNPMADRTLADPVHNYPKNFDETGGITPAEVQAARAAGVQDEAEALQWIWDQRQAGR